MTAKQALKKWQKLLKLQNWDIELEKHNDIDDEELIGMDGYVKILVADLKATIVVNENTSEPVEGVIVHECLHVLVRDITVVLNSLLRTEDAEDVFSAIDELLVRRLEKAFMELSPLDK